MAQHEEELEKVDVHEMWRYEAQDFTPWLAQNLDLLGKELGMRLENPQTEVPVGPLRLDILAGRGQYRREGRYRKPIGMDRHPPFGSVGHLCNRVRRTKIAIWVAPEFRYEYAEALHRLNEWTLDGVKFCGVKVEVFRRESDSCLEPRLTKVVYPDGWEEELILPPDPPMEPRVKKYHDFYQPLIDALTGTDFADSARPLWGNHDRIFPRVTTET